MCANVDTVAAKEPILRKERINARAYLEEKKRPESRRRRAPGEEQSHDAESGRRAAGQAGHDVKAQGHHE